MSCSKPQREPAAAERAKLILDDELVSKLTEKFEELNKKQLEKMEEINNKHKDEINKLHEKHERRLEKLQNDHNKQLADTVSRLQREHQETLETMQNRYEDTLRILQERNEQLENQPLYKAALKKFQGLSKLKKALVIIVLTIVAACAIWGAYTFVIWAFPYVISFVDVSFSYLVDLLESARVYVMGSEWFHAACKAIPTFCMERGDEILAYCGGGFMGLLVMFLRHTTGGNGQQV